MARERTRPERGNPACAGNRPKPVVTSAAFAVALAGLLASVAYAADPEPLDEDFLEYLAEFATADADWTWFASDADDEDVAEKEKPAAKPAPQQSAEKVKP
jgi:hypothetical protein